MTDTPKSYAAIITGIFENHHAPGGASFEFDRSEIMAVADAKGVGQPKNPGDVIYAFRTRQPLPEAITETAPPDRVWIIEGAGRSKYRFRLASATRIVPNPALVAVKLPDATPEIVARYAQGDEQSLLAQVRYNRLVDVFLSVTASSLQSHLRTTVTGVGQIEIDELYVAVDARGGHFVVPVQAKAGTDRIGVVQTGQDLAFCHERFPNVQPRAVAAQFMADEVIALFELVIEDGDVRIKQERHYRLVAAEDITDEEIAGYYQ